MDSTQADFVRLAKAIGLGTARSILDLLEAFEGNEPQPAKKISKRQQNALESLGEAVMSQLPQSGRGRKPDPNSAKGRVRTALFDYLKENGASHISVMVPALIKATGLSKEVVRNNAGQIPGIVRNYGTWSLKEAA